MVTRYLVLCVWCLSCWGCSTQSTQRQQVLSKQSVEQGRTLFASLCAGCHGAHARGNVGPDLTVSQYKYGKQRSDIVSSILNGRPAGMPAFNSHLNQDQAAHLADFLLSLQ